jgi:hypothetical protein
VIVVWCTNWHHKCIGKWPSVVASPATKWDLNVWIARSAAFRLWICGGTSWYVMLFCFRKDFTAVEALLSIIWKFGLSPASVSCLYRTVYALTASASAFVFIGSANIAFPSYSYNTNMYLFPLLDVVGNLLVRSVSNLPLISVMVVYTSRALR